MTPPVPPYGYELVDDEPIWFDLAWVCGSWIMVGADCCVVQADGDWAISAYDLRWIARKK